MDILFIFTRGPQAGQKAIVRDAPTLLEAMELAAKEFDVRNYKVDTVDKTYQCLTVFDYNDFETVFVRNRVIDGKVPERRDPFQVSVEVHKVKLQD